MTVPFPRGETMRTTLRLIEGPTCGPAPSAIDTRRGNGTPVRPASTPDGPEASPGTAGGSPVGAGTGLGRARIVGSATSENLYSRNARTKLSKSPPVELMAFSMRVIGAESLIRL